MRTFGATGEDVSELLDMIAARMRVVQIARFKKSCRRCERMMQGPAPRRPIPGSMAGPNLLAHVLVSKLTTIFLFTVSMKSSSVWGPTSPEAHLWAGAAAP